MFQINRWEANTYVSTSRLFQCTVSFRACHERGRKVHSFKTNRNAYGTVIYFERIINQNMYCIKTLFGLIKVLFRNGWFLLVICIPKIPCVEYSQFLN